VYVEPRERLLKNTDCQLSDEKPFTLKEGMNTYFLRSPRVSSSVNTDNMTSLKFLLLNLGLKRLR